MNKNYLNSNVNGLNKKDKKINENVCKTKAGVVKNISRKLLIGSSVLVLASTSLTGCKAYGFDYKNNGDGVRYATGTVDRNYIDDCYYIQVYNENFDDYEGNIVLKQNNYGKISYLDIFTLDTVYVEDDINYENLEVTNIISIGKYLEDKGIEKKDYDVEYMEELLEEINTDSNNKVKQLTKEGGPLNDR